MTASLLSPLADLQSGVGSDRPVWGIDTATTRFSTGIIRPEDGALVADSFERGDGWAVVTKRLPKREDGPRRQGEQYAVLVDHFSLLRDALGYPLFVILETPFSRPSKGRNSVHPESFYAVAAGAAALCATVPDAALDYIGPSEWKRPALGDGRGNAKKPEILAWARDELGYQGECVSCGNVSGGTLLKECPNTKPAHDEADALGLGVAAARRLATRGEVIVP